MVKPIFSKKENEYIKTHWNNMTYSEITIELNKFNDIEKKEKQVRNRARTMGICKINKDYNNRYFQYIDTPEKAYWLGFIYADGYVVENKENRNHEVGIELNGVDTEHLQKFADTLGKGIIVKHRDSRDRVIDGNFVKGGIDNAFIRIFSAPMFRDLTNHGVVPNKTYKDDLPIFNEYFIDFLRGFFDGDGSVYNSHEHLGFNITNPNIKLLNIIQEQLLEIGITSYVYTEQKWKSRLIIDTETNTENFGHLLYDNASIYLERKYDKYLSLKVKTA